MLHDVYFFGPLRVLVNSATGEIVSVQDRISGLDASFSFRPEFIARAKEHARMRWEACIDACV